MYILPQDIVFMIVFIVEGKDIVTGGDVRGAVRLIKSIGGGQAVAIEDMMKVVGEVVVKLSVGFVGIGYFFYSP